MSSIARSDALELVKRARTEVGVYTDSTSWFSGCVSWLCRTVLSVPKLIKKFILFYNHPVASFSGLLLRDAAINRNCAWIVVACRVVSVVRPLVELSAACDGVREHAKAAVKSMCGDKQSAVTFFRGKKVVDGKVKGYLNLFHKYMMPNFAKRLLDLVVNTGKTAWYTYDLIESLTASDAEIVERSIAELFEMVQQAQSGRLLEAITFNETWIKQLLSKFKTKVSIETVKDIVIEIGNINTQKFASMSFTDMVLAMTARARSKERK